LISIIILSSKAMNRIVAIGAIAVVFAPLNASALDYVQCNAMREAYDREMALLISERYTRRQHGLKRTVEACGLPPVAGATEDVNLKYKSCHDTAYADGVAGWDRVNRQISPKTGEPIGSPYAKSLLRIMEDMNKGGCPLPGGSSGVGK
jgi:hypothetical protein